MDERQAARRACLKAVSTGIVLATSTLLLGCQRDDGATCTDTEMLTDAERTARASLKYIDRMPQRERRCDVCVQFVPPAKDSSCGQCKLMPGPVHPLGGCLAWAAKG